MALVKHPEGHWCCVLFDGTSLQVRYLALLFVDEIFRRSAVFRQLLVPMFETFLELTLGMRTDKPLPEPRSAAKRLQVGSQCYLRELFSLFDNLDLSPQSRRGHLATAFTVPPLKSVCTSAKTLVVVG